MLYNKYLYLIKNKRSQMLFKIIKPYKLYFDQLKHIYILSKYLFDKQNINL